MEARSLQAGTQNWDEFRCLSTSYVSSLGPHRFTLLLIGFSTESFATEAGSIHQLLLPFSLRLLQMNFQLRFTTFREDMGSIAFMRPLPGWPSASPFKSKGDRFAFTPLQPQRSRSRFYFYSRDFGRLLCHVSSWRGFFSQFVSFISLYARIGSTPPLRYRRGVNGASP